MISFDKVKDVVTTRQAAEMYGIDVNRHGFARCPFHHERTASMKVDKRYHCFGCQEDGDVIDFTAKLFGLNLKDAAEKLAVDFNIDATCEDYEISQTTQLKERKETIEDRFNHCWKIYSKYLHLLKQWKEQYEPRSENELLDSRYLEAIQQIDRVEYQLDELSRANWDDRRTIINRLKKDMEEIAKKLDKSRTFSTEGSSR